MVLTRSQYYRSPSPNYLEGPHTENFGPAVDTNEAFEPILTLDTTSRLQVLSVGTFDDIDDDPRQMVRDRFSRQARDISLPDWKLRFRIWMKRSANGLRASTIGMPSSCYHNIWNMKHLDI